MGGEGGGRKRRSTAEAVNLCQDTLGNAHPNTLYHLQNLAVGLTKQGRHNEGESLLDRVLELRQQVLGDRHPDTASSMAHLGRTYLLQGRQNDGELALTRALECYMEISSEDGAAMANIFMNSD